MSKANYIPTPICELPPTFDPRRIGEDDILQSVPVERIHGDYKARPVAWINRLTGLSRGVARVKNEFDCTIGSGFLAHLDCPHYRGVGFITSTHVDDSIAGSARISFDERQPYVNYMTERVWSSPANELDVTIYSLLPCHDNEGIDCGDHESVALTLAEQEPPEWITTDTGQRRRPRVFPIGLPGGGALSISIEDNLLSGIRSRQGTPLVRMLHYKAPTHCGSSGGPVICENQKVVAIHRAGGDTTQSYRIFPLRRNINEGTSAAALLNVLQSRHPGH